MRLLKSGNLMVLLLLCCGPQLRAQEVIDQVGMEKNSDGSYKVQFKLNSAEKFDVAAIVLKIYRRRQGKVEEIFSRDVAPVSADQRQDKLYTYEWKPDEGILKTGDEVRANVAVTLKPAVAKMPAALPNKPPHADAGKNIQVQLPVTRVIALNGGQSRDEDGKIVSSYWRQAAGPSSLTIMNRDSLFTYVAGQFKQGSYIFELSVTDDRGASASSRTILTVKPAAAAQQVNTTPAGGMGNASKKRFSTLNGGAAPAAINLLVPGLGHYFVSGDENGAHRKPGSFLVTAAYAASIGGAFYFSSRSDAQYKKYNELANFRDYQRDGNGEIIGVRGANQAKANEYFTQAKAAHRNSLIALGVGGSILVGDLVYTLIKGNSNKRKWEQSIGAVKPQFFISSDGVAAKAGIQINF